jgi:hypothetical protein
LLVEEENIGSTLQEGVGGRETGETATDDDDLGHLLLCSRRGVVVVDGKSEGSRAEGAIFDFIDKRSRYEQARRLHVIIATPDVTRRHQ